ncbi:uncharacterized protein [Dermacentor albipictus]|uniref:uncharacterized protein isoform X4 n=1 Tax=Dermacentor albipictus TaxID=60249 RepID=UPI0031FD74D0
MAPRLWLWLHVATAMVAVSCTYHHERHPHIRRSHTEHHHFLGNFPLNGTKGKDSHISLDSRPSSGPLPYSAPYEDRAQPTPSGHSTRRHQRHQHRRRTHSHRVPDIIYSFGSQSAAKLLYRGKGYRVGPYTGYVDVWTIPRQSRPQYLPPPRLTPPPSPPPSPPHLQRQEEHFPEGTAFARVLIAPEPSNAVSPAEPRTCLRCPKDRTVWVGPGFSCAEVPKPRLRPCSRLASLPGEVRMTATAGPQPGSLVMEGVYQMGFTFQAPGIAPQSCHYKLRVKVRRCPALQRLHNGGARCSRGRHWGSRCRFFCKPGYALEQRVAARCAIHDGVRVTWTPHPAPVCRAKNDSAPTATTNAIIPDTVMPTRPATEASVPTTPSKKVFPATGSPRPPKRWKQLACRWPKAPLHGWVSCDRGATRKARVVAREGTRCRQGCRWAPQSVVTHFSCVAGAWQGRKALGCTGPPQASTEPAPTELPRTTESGCEGPSPVPNSALECSADANTLGRRPVDTICRHVCDKGYDVLPSQLPLAQVTCLANGKWHQEDQPRCVKSGCASPVILPNSLLDCSKQINHLGNRPTGTICKVACKEGFILSPNQQHVNEIICEEDGTWNQTAEFECHKSGCSSPDLVPDSSLECSNDANHLGHHPTGTSCKIVCNMGLGLPPDMQALNHFVCQEDGTWNQTTQLECSSIGCPSSKQVPGSSLECSMAANRFGKHPTGTICKVVCADGLSLPSSLQSLNQFVCQEDGTWNQTTQLECRNNGCPSPKPVPDSSLDCSADVDQFGQWPTGTACQVVCADGLALPSSLQPLNYFMCQEDGTWNQTTQLECRNNGCPSPKPVPDSSLDCSPDVDQFGQWPIGTACQIVCADGLALPSSLQPLNYIVCQEDGTWNQTTQLECRNNGCPSPNPVPDSSLDCSADVDQFGQWPTGTACQVVCADGLALPSSLQPLNYFVCQEDGTWNQTAQLECRNSGCARPDPVPGASLECSKDGEDLGKWPTGSICNVVCNEGLALPLNLQSLNLFVCLEDGTWNQTAQLECREAGCKSPTQVEDSVLNCTAEANSLGRWPTGAICSYDCKEGYGLATNQLPFSRIACHDDGTWNQTEQLRCKKTGCEDPSAVQFSMVNCSGTANTFGRWPVGTECSHVCDEGYAVSRHEVHLNLFICLDDGTWNQTEGLHCRETGCEEPGKVPHSALNCSSDFNALGKRPFGTVCSYVCNEGFAVPRDLEPHNQLVCSEDGSWNQKEELLCLKTGCESPQVVQNSVLHCSESANVIGNWPAGTTCQHICDNGFVIPQSQLGLGDITCLDDGTWNETGILQCLKLRDPQLSQGCKDEVVVVDGHNVSFPVTIEAPTFKAFNGTNAAVRCTATHVTTYGTHVIVCDAVDTELQSTSSCTYNVTALASGCPPLQSDPYSRVSCSADRNVTEGHLHPVGDVCEYICQRHGYVIPQSKVDSAVKECLPNGSWSNDDFDLCEEQLVPLRVSGCEDMEFGTDELGNTTVPRPLFRTPSGLVNATCTPEMLVDFGDHVIHCVAEDHDLRSSASCSFKVIVKGETVPRLRETGPGCVDVQEVHDKYPVHLKPPAFEAASGGAALVICDPATLLGPGAYNVTCTARDNKTQAETQCAYVVNARQIEQFRESQCLSLRAPANGDIRCKRRMGLIKCRFSCFPDHVMSTKSFPLLARGYVVCDRAQRDRFDFQEEYGLDELPACTRLPTPTYFQGSLTFHVGLPSCSLENLHTDFMPTLTEALLDRAADVCLQADCDNVTFMCETAVLRNSSDPSSASDAMKVVWTVQARHNVNASYDIPEAETVIEQIQVLTHDIVTSDPGFYQEIAKVGGDLWRDSFRQSKFTLVCGSRGFTIDDHTAHCVPCPSGTFEEHGSCHPCPQNHYQDSEGQTSCKPCPKHTFSFEGAKMVKDCTEFAGPNVPPPARDAPAWQPHERHGPCSPNPCRHQGICYLQRGGYTCLCQQHYRGRHCEESA